MIQRYKDTRKLTVCCRQSFGLLTIANSGEYFRKTEYILKHSSHPSTSLKLSNRNMAKKIVSPVITLAPLVIASSVGKPQEKEVCCLGGKTLISLCLQKKNRNPANLNGLSSGACEIIFLWRGSLAQVSVSQVVG